MGGSEWMKKKWVRMGEEWMNGERIKGRWMDG